MDHWWEMFRLKNSTDRTMPMNRPLNMRSDSTRTMRPDTTKKVSNDTIR